jgi:hypothetical protein
MGAVSSGPIGNSLAVAAVKWGLIFLVLLAVAGWLHSSSGGWLP